MVVMAQYFSYIRNKMKIFVIYTYENLYISKKCTTFATPNNHSNFRLWIFL